MDGLALTTSSFFSSVTSFSPRRRRARNLSFPVRPNKFMVYAAKEEPELDQWDQMELKFGRLLGEDPKLTLAKIMGRKVNPDASYIEIEKSFYKNNGKIVEVEELPFDALPKRGSSTSSQSLEGLNLLRPVPKKGVKFQVDDDKQIIKPDLKKPKKPVGKVAVSPKPSSVPNVILRKPTTYNEDEDVEDIKALKLRFKPNLSLKMKSGPVEDRFSDMMLLRKPEQINLDQGVVEKKEKDYGDEEINRVSDLNLLKKPEAVIDKTEIENKDKQNRNLQALSSDDIGENYSDNRASDETSSDFEETEDKLVLGLQRRKPSDNVSYKTTATLQGKPDRLDQALKESLNSGREEAAVMNSGSYKNTIEFENLPSTSALEESEDADWTRAEYLANTGDRADVDLISSSPRGFVVSFGALLGFLPYRNLAARWKFLAFESWLRQKGLDPSMYKRNLEVLGSYDGVNKNFGDDPGLSSDTDTRIDRELSPDIKLEDLLTIYDQEKTKFLSSFVGQKIKANVVLANRKSRKLMFSLRPKEKEELVEKKKSLMAKLQIGDVVKCTIKKITYFGIFVEVEGVTALIHQTEVSWDTTLNPTSKYKIGQVIEAKVHQLDFSLERIFLSLKEILPDPLNEALDSVIGDRNPLDERLEAAEIDTEWAEVESLIKQLQEIEGIQSVSKGRFFFSPGLAPTFQVYMASMFENQYKLLARSGNKVQEVIVQTSLDKEEMKSAILTSTNNVE